MDQFPLQYAPGYIHLTCIKPPHSKFLYRVEYNGYHKYYYSDIASVRDFMIHCKDTAGSTKVEYIGRVFSDD